MADETPVALQDDINLDEAFLVAEGTNAQQRVDDILRRRHERLRTMEQPEAQDLDAILDAAEPVEAESTQPEESAAPPVEDEGTIAGEPMRVPQRQALQVVGGVRDAVVNTMQNIHALGNWMRSKGFGPQGFLTINVPEVSKPENISESLIRSTAQFLTGFVPGMKAAGWLSVTGKVTQGMLAGVIADLSVFDPQQPRLSNMLHNLAPEILQPLTAFIMSDPNDGRAEALFKQALEGLALGGLVDGLMLTGRTMRLARATRNAASQTDDLAGAAAQSIDDIEVRPEPADIASVKTRDGYTDLTLTEEFEGRSPFPLRDRPDNILELQEFLRKHGGVKTQGEELSGELTALVSPKESGTTGLMNNRTGKTLQEMAELAEEAGFTLSADKTDLLEALDRSVRGSKVLSSQHPQILAQLGLTDELMQAYQDFKRVSLNYDDLTDEMVGGVRHLSDVTDEAAELIASKQFTLEDVRAIFPNQALNDTQASAMMQSLTKLGLTAQKLATLARQTGTDESFAHFLAAMKMLGELDPARMGSRAANSRALGVWRDPVKQFNQYLNQFEDVLNIGRRLDQPGGSTLTRDDFLQAVEDLKSPQELASMARHIEKNVDKATWRDVAREAWYGALLSGPQTQMANIISNAMTTVWAIPERWLAAGIGDGVAAREGTDLLYGYVKSMPDAFRAFGRSFAAEAPLETRRALGKTTFTATPDITTKLETRVHQAISAEALELSGSLGGAVNYAGQVVRTGPRFLTAFDEFFKGINYRGQLHALAGREARRVAQSPDDIGRLMAEFINNPPKRVHEAAQDFAFYQTFTRELTQEGVPFERIGQAGQKAMEFFDTVPMGRVIAPFIRTPTNILRYSMERSPLGVFSSNIRAAIRAGGPEAALAKSKMMLGTSMMAMFAAYSAEGRISGRGPSNPALRARLRDTGWQPYSIRFGDTWVSYNRIDPLGQLIGLSSDISQILGEVDEVTASRMIGASLSSIWQNLSSKTYMRGVAEAVKVLAPESWVDPERSVAPGERFVTRLAGSVVPTFLAQVARTHDKTLREVRAPGFLADILNTAYSRIPGWSDDLPPRLNFWAEPILLGGGLGPDLISPLYVNTRKGEPVSDEIVRLRMPLRMPGRALSFRDGARPLELTAPEYNELVELTNGIGVEGVPRLRDAIRTVIDTDAYTALSDGPNGAKALAIRAVVDTYKSAARGLLQLNNPELGRRIRERQNEVRLQRVPAEQRDALREQLQGADPATPLEGTLGIIR